MANRAYILAFGSRESRTIYGDDRYAKRVAARWIRRFWRKYCAYIHAKHPGSMADAECNAWYTPAECRIYRRPATDSAGIYPCTPNALIEKFDLEPGPIAEFFRVTRVAQTENAKNKGLTL
jgi:hypothetical protein